jgi:hypothetical protein
VKDYGGLPHQHQWEMSGLVIDTYPPQSTWYCVCGAASHDGGTTLCDIKHFGQPTGEPDADEGT